MVVVKTRFIFPKCSESEKNDDWASDDTDNSILFSETGLAKTNSSSQFDNGLTILATVFRFGATFQEFYDAIYCSGRGNVCNEELQGKARKKGAPASLRESRRCAPIGQEGLEPSTKGL